MQNTHLPPGVKQENAEEKKRSEVSGQRSAGSARGHRGAETDHRWTVWTTWTQWTRQRLDRSIESMLSMFPSLGKDSVKFSKGWKKREPRFPSLGKRTTRRPEGLRVVHYYLSAGLSSPCRPYRRRPEAWRELPSSRGARRPCTRSSGAERRWRRRSEARSA